MTPANPRRAAFGRAPAFAAALLLAGCTITPPPAQVPAATPAQWQAPLPHGGRVADLRQWWSQWNDPVLAELVDAAQAASPDIATAAARVGQARATRAQAAAALLPSLDATANISRGPLQTGGLAATQATSGQAGVQAQWEIDLFGGTRATRDAAVARLEGADAAWHEARVSVAAEVANQYFAQRACERQLQVAQGDARSRAETARLNDESQRAGFTAPATAALARASAAEGSGRALQRQAQCDLGVKALVALTALDESRLRARLAGPPAPAVSDTGFFVIDQVPARVLAQRPDLYRAEREVAAASADTGSAQAARYPRLSLGGFVGRTAYRIDGSTFSSNSWTLGPLAVSVPLFDGGRTAAGVDAARARYDEAVATYAGRVRQAVREVEEALVNLDSTRARGADAQAAVAGYRASFAATEARWRNGLASLVELEDARRTLLAADATLIDLQRERESAWVALYRATGGGWQRPEGAAPLLSPQAAAPAATAALPTASAPR